MPRREKIVLNDLLRLTDEEIARAKLRFMVPSGRIQFNPLMVVDDIAERDKINLVDLVYNRDSSVSFNRGVIAIGFLPLGEDRWLMTGIVDIVEDCGRGKAAKAEYRDQKFNFRVVVGFHKKSQQGIRLAGKVLKKLEVLEILEPNKKINDDRFPGYKNVIIDYRDLKNRLKNSEQWRVSLKNRKGVYLITDKKTGKLYVGSAYGKTGIYGRWKTYVESGYDKKEVESGYVEEIENGKYPNKRLQKLVQKEGMAYVEENFQYSILETFTDEVPDEEIIQRESWWKEVVLSRNFGYNAN